MWSLPSFCKFCPFRFPILGSWMTPEYKLLRWVWTWNLGFVTLRTKRYQKLHGLNRRNLVEIPGMVTRCWSWCFMNRIVVLRMKWFISLGPWHLLARHVGVHICTYVHPSINNSLISFTCWGRETKDLRRQGQGVWRAPQGGELWGHGWYAADFSGHLIAFSSMGFTVLAGLQ